MRPEAEYMRTGGKCLGLEHCFRLIRKIMVGSEGWQVVVMEEKKLQCFFFFRSKDNRSLGMKVMSTCYNSLTIYKEDTKWYRSDKMSVKHRWQNILEIWGKLIEP